MVDVIRCAYAVTDTVEIVDGRKNIINGNVFRNQIVAACRKLFQQRIFIVAALVKHFAQDFKTNLFVDADFFQFRFGKHRYIFADVHHTVREHFDLVALIVNDGNADALLLNTVGKLRGNEVAFVRKNFTRQIADNRLFRLKSCNTVGNAEFLIVFVTADTRQIIAMRVEEQAVQMRLRGFECRRLAGTKLFINLDKRLLGIDGGILFKCCFDTLIIAEKF